VKNRTLLCADDSPTIQKVVKLTFPEDDVKVVCVSDGDTAIRKYRELKPDLVLLDASIPVRDGYEVCEYIKRQTEGKAPPVVLLSSALEEFDSTRARQALADAFMAKPFHSNVLREKVHSLLGGPASSALPRREEPFSAMIDAEHPVQGGQEDKPDGAAHRPAAPAADPTLSAGDLDTIVKRLAEIVTPRLIEELSWEILPDLVEREIRRRLG
jgi:DNA-binding response OmpR family regulator